jgi:hypothetical protein
MYKHNEALPSITTLIHVSFAGDVPPEERDEPFGAELTWSPERIPDPDLLMFLRSARSVTALAAMCADGGSPEDGAAAAARDGITAQAIDVLHRVDYDTGMALKVNKKLHSICT